MQHGYNMLLSHALLSVTWSLMEVKIKRKFQTLAIKWPQSLTRGGRLQEISNNSNVALPGHSWYFGKLVAEKRWLLTRDGHN